MEKLLSDFIIGEQGDPIEVTIRGYELSLRKTEAAAVTMEVEDK